MKKPFANTVKSDVKCSNCKKPLKKNLVVRKGGKAKLCYPCHIFSEGLKGHRMKGLPLRPKEEE